MTRMHRDIGLVYWFYVTACVLYFTAIVVASTRSTVTFACEASSEMAAPKKANLLSSVKMY